MLTINREEKMNTEKPKTAFILLACLGILFILLALFAGVFQVNRTLNEAGMVQGLPELNLQKLQETAAGAAVLITGSLEANGQQADVGDLLIYLAEEWYVRYNDSEGSEGWEGSWCKLETVVPACAVVLADGSVTLDAGQDTVIDNPLHEFKSFVPRNAREVDGVKEGSIRHQGFKAGDEVTIIGTKSAAGIIPSLIFGGDRQALEQSFTYRVSGLRLTGVIFALVGIGLLITSFVLQRKNNTA
jgi:hypothetical protein